MTKDGRDIGITAYSELIGDGRLISDVEDGLARGEGDESAQLL